MMAYALLCPHNSLTGGVPLPVPRSPCSSPFLATKGGRTLCAQAGKARRASAAVQTLLTSTVYSVALTPEKMPETSLAAIAGVAVVAVVGYPLFWCVITLQGLLH